MTPIFRTLTLLICLLGLSACACPRTEPWYDEPYGYGSDDRTAGTGLVGTRQCAAKILPISN